MESGEERRTTEARIIMTMDAGAITVRCEGQVKAGWKSMKQRITKSVKKMPVKMESEHRAVTNNEADHRTAFERKGRGCTPRAHRSPEPCSSHNPSLLFNTRLFPTPLASLHHMPPPLFPILAVLVVVAALVACAAFLVPKGPNQVYVFCSSFLTLLSPEPSSTIRTALMLTLTAAYLMWMITYLAQLHPLIRTYPAHVAAMSSYIEQNPFIQ